MYTYLHICQSIINIYVCINTYRIPKPSRASESASERGYITFRQPLTALTLALAISSQPETPKLKPENRNPRAETRNPRPETHRNPL